jgi:hypothetical protein
VQRGLVPGLMELGPSDILLSTRADASALTRPTNETFASTFYPNGRTVPSRLSLDATWWSSLRQWWRRATIRLLTDSNL